MSTSHENDVVRLGLGKGLIKYARLKEGGDEAVEKRMFPREWNLVLGPGVSQGINERIADNTRVHIWSIKRLLVG